MAPSFIVSFKKGGIAEVINTFQVTFLEVTPRMAALVLLFRLDFRRSIRHQFQCLDV